MKKLKTWDTVIVISGKNKGKVATIKQIKQVSKKKGNVVNTFVYLDWVNVAKRAKKWQWFVDVILPIHISNVKYYDQASKKSSKVSILIENGKKFRFLKKLDKKI